jgi:hypothetical protein
MAWFGIGAILFLVGFLRILISDESRELWKQLLIPPAMLMTGFLTAKVYWNFLFDILSGRVALSPTTAQNTIVVLCGVTPPLLAYFAWRSTRRKQEPSA